MTISSSLELRGILVIASVDLQVKLRDVQWIELEPVTARIKERTDHLKGLKIAVMGCIVNGPGEMADADFGYVGSAPGLVNLYVGKEIVERSVPEAEADDRLIALLQEHGRWREPTPAPSGS